MGIALDYPLTRSFPSRILAPIVFTGAAISLVILVVLNTALTAYQVVVTPSADFNISVPQWYDAFLPASLKKPGNKCDPVILGTGSIITTNQSIFSWAVERSLKADAGRTSFLYKGGDLDSCDITNYVISGDLSARSADIQVFAECNPSDKVSYVLKTTLNIAELAARNLPSILGGSTQGSPEVGYAGQVCDALINAAGQDLLTELLTFTAFNPVPQLNLLTASADLVFCPSSNSSGNVCQTETPKYTFAFAGVSYSNGTFVSAFADEGTVGQIMTPFFSAPANNLLQALAACVRIDFGQNNTNNLLLNPANAIPSGAILATFPAGNGVPEYQTIIGKVLANPASFLINDVPVLPVPRKGPSVYEVAFSCRLKRLKSPGEAFIAVLVATMSMFMSGWAIFMFGAVTILKTRRQDANLCIGCIDAQTTAQIQRPGPYTMQSGVSDYSKHAHSPIAMPSPDPLPVPYLANQQYQGKTY